MNGCPVRRRCHHPRQLRQSCVPLPPQHSPPGCYRSESRRSTARHAAPGGRFREHGKNRVVDVRSRTITAAGSVAHASATPHWGARRHEAQGSEAEVRRSEVRAPFLSAAVSFQHSAHLAPALRSKGPPDWRTIWETCGRAEGLATPRRKASVGADLRQTNSLGRVGLYPTYKSWQN